MYNMFKYICLTCKKFTISSFIPDRFLFSDLKINYWLFFLYLFVDFYFEAKICL